MTYTLIDLVHAGYIRPDAPIDHEFKREDENQDADFYQHDPMVEHLDETALYTVKELISSLLPQTGGHILDLMSSADSHLPDSLKPEHVVGLGLNQNGLTKNRALDHWIIHDLNQNPIMPFTAGSFDNVLNIAGVEYLIDPVAVFKDVGRVLKPGGLFLIVFSNRFLEPKVTAIWRRTSEAKRMAMVETWLWASECFDEPSEFVITGLPRPIGGGSSRLDLSTDPVYAVYAKRNSTQAV